MKKIKPTNYKRAGPTLWNQITQLVNIRDHP